ncbi:hypothetical protein [Haloparvum sp. PAK95]|uniref:hypothetical protein n=1 Tax=Haloparvum sp. PAK95 TaxID=3418962 RepID=UPI003D2F23AF
MDRAISPLFGVVMMVILTILLASMFVVALPELFDLGLAETNAEEVMSGGVGTESQAAGDDSGSQLLEAAKREIVFTDEQGALFSLRTDRTIVHYQPPEVESSGDWNVEGVGPKKVDFDDDGNREIPYVNGSNYLKLIDENNETQVLVNDARKNLVAVGSWGNGDTIPTWTAVYYAGSSGNRLFRARLDSDGNAQSECIADISTGKFVAVAGVVDYDGDGSTEVVYVYKVDQTAKLGYLTPDGTSDDDVGSEECDAPSQKHQPIRKIADSNGYGTGEPSDFDGDGTVQAPMLNKSSDPIFELVTHDGTAETLTENGTPKKASIRVADWVDNDEMAVVYVGDGETLYYVTASGERVLLTDADGDPIEADADQGVA